MAEPKAHQLYKQVGATGVTVVNASAGTVTVTGGWEVIQADADAVFVTSRSYIDLSAWTKQDLTTFTQGVDIQKSLIPIKDPGEGGEFIV